MPSVPLAADQDPTNPFALIPAFTAAANDLTVLANGADGGANFHKKTKRMIGATLHLLLG